MNSETKSCLVCCLLPAIVYIFVILMLFIFLLQILSRAGGPCSGVKSWVLNAILVGDYQKAKDTLCGLSKDAFGAPADAATGDFFYSGGSSSVCKSTGIINVNAKSGGKDYMPWLNDTANSKFNGDVALIMSIINVESAGWDPKSVSSIPPHAAGLTQFLPTTAVTRPEFVGGTIDGKTWPKGTINSGDPTGTDDARFDPERAIYAGASYFAYTMALSDIQSYPPCKDAVGIDLAYCAYIFHYNGGCFMKDGGKLSLTDAIKQDIKCKRALDAGQKMKDVYAKLFSSGQCTATTQTPGPSSGKVFGDSSSMSCSVGTDSGVADGYRNGKLYKIRLCKIQGITVNAQIVENVNNLMTAAKSAGVRLTGGSYRTMQQQKDLRIKNGCPDYDKSPSSSCKTPTAKAGYSNHQMGVGVDFYYNGKLIQSKSSPGFLWLQENAAKYGLYNFPAEAWHWSIDGK